MRFNRIHLFTFLLSVLLTASIFLGFPQWLYRNVYVSFKKWQTQQELEKFASLQITLTQDAEWVNQVRTASILLPNEFKQKVLARAELLENKAGTFYLFNKDSLIYWSKSGPVIPSDYIHTCAVNTWYQIDTKQWEGFFIHQVAEWNPRIHSIYYYPLASSDYDEISNSNTHTFFSLKSLHNFQTSISINQQSLPVSVASVHITEFNQIFFTALLLILGILFLMSLHQLHTQGFSFIHKITILIQYIALCYMQYIYWQNYLDRAKVYFLPMLLANLALCILLLQGFLQRILGQKKRSPSANKISTQSILSVLGVQGLVHVLHLLLICSFTCIFFKINSTQFRDALITPGTLFNGYLAIASSILLGAYFILIYFYKKEINGYKLSEKEFLLLHLISVIPLIAIMQYITSWNIAFKASAFILLTPLIIRYYFQDQDTYSIWILLWASMFAFTFSMLYPELYKMILNQSTQSEITTNSLLLFSWVFLLFLIGYILFVLINSFIHFITDAYQRAHVSSNLKNRLQAYLILLIAVAFVANALVSFVHLSKTTEHFYSMNTLSNTQIIKSLYQSNTLQSPDSISQLLSLPSGIQHIYQKDGRLVQTPLDNVHTMLSPSAYFTLNYFPDTIWQKSKQSLSRWDTPGVFRINNSGKNFFIGIKPMINTNITEIQGGLLAAIINIYVFLFFIASAIAFITSRSIHRPLLKIGEHLRRIQLGIYSEPLQWNTRDELGALISEYNRMIQQLQQSAQLLAQSERQSAWRDMAQQIAHEIKNPLTPMRLQVQYLENRSKEHPEHSDPYIISVCKTLVEQIDNLSNLANQFSSLAKLPEPKLEHICINTFIQQMVELHRFNEKNIPIHFKNAEVQYFVHFDKTQLSQILSNLIKNAIQANLNPEEGNIEICIASKEVQQKSMVTISIMDNGIGIHAEDIARIFEPYFTTKTSGTGIGLAVVKQILEQSGGYIYVESHPDSGTIFYIDLPVSSNSEVDPKSEVSNGILRKDLVL